MFKVNNEEIGCLVGNNELSKHNLLFPCISAGIYLFKFSYGNTRIIFEIWSKLTIKTPEQQRWRYSGVVIANFEHILYIFFPKHIWDIV